MSALDGLLATGWAISAGERYRNGDAELDEVQAACEAARGAYAMIDIASREARAACCAAKFADAICHRYVSDTIEVRRQAARRAFRAAYP